MTNFDQRLRDAGIIREDIETQIQSADTALVLTARELVLLEDTRVQRARLRDITAVKIVKTGELNVRSAVETMIEGNVLGFEKTERKLFFDAVKEATARAKASVTNASLPGLTPAPMLESPAPTERTSPAVPSAPVRDPVNDTADDWRALLSAPAQSSPPIFNDPPFEPGPSQPHNSHPSAPVLEPREEEAAVLNPTSDLSPVSEPGMSHPTASHEADPWTANKQTFEVEPEKPVAAASNDPWVSAGQSSAGQSSAAHDQSAPNASSNAGNAGNAGWDDPFDPPAPALNGASSSPAITSVQVSNDWGGETLNASTALGTGAASGIASSGGSAAVEQAERKVTVLGADNTGTLLVVSRWLRILAVIFALSSAVFVVTLAPNDSANVLGYLILIPIMFGSFLLSLMAWGLGELLSAYAASSQDLRTIRRATLGH